jgi:hypothetical protein
LNPGIRGAIGSLSHRKENIKILRHNIDRIIVYIHQYGEIPDSFTGNHTDFPETARTDRCRAPEIGRRSHIAPDACTPDTAVAALRCCLVHVTGHINKNDNTIHAMGGLGVMLVIDQICPAARRTPP